MLSTRCVARSLALFLVLALSLVECEHGRNWLQRDIPSSFFNGPRARSLLAYQRPGLRGGQDDGQSPVGLLQNALKGMRLGAQGMAREGGKTNTSVASAASHSDAVPEDTETGEGSSQAAPEEQDAKEKAKENEKADQAAKPVKDERLQAIRSLIRQQLQSEGKDTTKKPEVAPKENEVQHSKQQPPAKQEEDGEDDEEGENNLPMQILSFALRRPFLTMMLIDTAIETLKSKRIPKSCILEIDLGKIRVTSGEVEIESYFEALQYLDEPAISVRGIVQALDRAATDRRVKGIIVHIPAESARKTGFDFATVQELRDAIIRFRSHGKIAVAWAESFPEGGRGNLDYLLACSCQLVFLQPSGSLSLSGFNIEVSFYRELLDRLKILPQFGGREEYKSAMNSYTEKRFTREQRENLNSLLQSWYEQLTGGISESRNISVAQLKSIIDKPPMFAADALDAGLVDALLYRDGVYNAVRKLAKEGPACVVPHWKSMKFHCNASMLFNNKFGDICLAGGDQEERFCSWLNGSLQLDDDALTVRGSRREWSRPVNLLSKVEKRSRDELKIFFSNDTEVLQLKFPCNHPANGWKNSHACDRDSLYTLIKSYLKHSQAKVNTDEVMKKLKLVPWTLSPKYDKQEEQPGIFRAFLSSAMRFLGLMVPDNDSSLLYVHKYADRVDTSLFKRLLDGLKPRIAFVHACGDIICGESSSSSVGADSLCRTLREVRGDRKVKAVIIRVDSPGGSALASDTMWREIMLIRAKGIPVVVSMGSMAASGGYFISAPANTIIAQEGTITGSIGVLSGKMVLGSFFADLIGVTHDSITLGKFAAMESSLRPFSEEERKVFEESLDRTYKDFLSKVALGRGTAVLKARADLVEKNIQLQLSSASVVNFCGLEQLASIGLKEKLDHVRRLREEASALSVLRVCSQAEKAEAKAVNVVSNVLRWLTMKRSSEEEERNLAASFDPSNVSAVELQTVRLIAGGRVWTGQEAKERGLVDELGGIHAAIDAAKKFAKIPARRSVDVRLYPRRRRSIWLSRFLDAESPDNSQGTGFLTMKSAGKGGGRGHLLKMEDGLVQGLSRMWDEPERRGGNRVFEDLQGCQLKEEEVLRRLHETPLERLAGSLLAIASLPLKTLRLASWPLRSLLR
ncbi:signal peptide peptidase SppA [Guillardia theta CCMP2712]|uniref:Signal peptide peptidase SppA n=3 Tax=Guillardia theta TaxID=55529 RepID=L1J473_GUITC|nr:signal peptide peptidase SppA [Guillardia theta CCMP2712]EKX43318.1 signal peptide peptidase SppA [Guillardia theta CCMP2712]|eukprot:XP_005830298.1 signal peptide peptidase SppA [Guillardia theta CCMP2712]